MCLFYVIYVFYYSQEEGRWPILAQCSISILTENVRKSKVFWLFQGGIGMGHWTKMGWALRDYRDYIQKEMFYVKKYS